MKLISLLATTAAAITLPAIMVAGYGMGGYGGFGGPRVVVPPPFVVSAGPSGGVPRTNNNARGVDRDFDRLRSELNGHDHARHQLMMSQEQIRKQQEWVRRALDLASDVVTSAAAVVSAEEQEDGRRPRQENGRNDEQQEIRRRRRRQEQEWWNRAFGLANDVVSGNYASSSSSSNYEIRADNDRLFQVALDVPGVRASDIDISVEPKLPKGSGGTAMQVLTVSGERSDGVKENPAEEEEEEEGDSRRLFSKSFWLDDTVDTDNITAELNNGVLVVTARKKVPEEKEGGKKIPVKSVSE